MISKTKYLRDGRAPIPQRELTSKVMSSNKDHDTKPELQLRRALWKEGLKGYRLHWKKAAGRPDICWPGRKVAVFVNGCYWHRCPHCNLALPKSNTQWWKEKFERNKARDQRKLMELETNGWRVLTVWECEINKNLEEAVKKVKELLSC